MHFTQPLYLVYFASSLHTDGFGILTQVTILILRCPLVPFIDQKLVQRLVELQKRNGHLETKVKSIEIQNETLVQAASLAKSQGTPENQQRVAELDRRIQELNEERADMYKIQSANAQRLVEMNDKIRVAEQTEKQHIEEIKELSSKIKHLSAKVELQIEQLREKDVTIQILQDELAAIQLEIVSIEQRNKKLEGENAQLLQRWLEKMNQEADKMNEATEFYETFLEQARSAGQTIRKSGGKWVIRPSISSEMKSSSSSSSPSPATRRLHVSSVILPTKVFRRLSSHDSEVFCVRASSTGAMFATGGADKKVKIHNVKTGNVTMTLGGSLQTVTSVAFNSTDELVLGTSTDNSTRIWSLATSRTRHTLTGHIGKVFAAQFTADSKRVVSGSHDRTLKVWDLNRGYCTRTIFTFSSCNDLALVDVDGQTLASGHLDNNIRLWDTRTGNGIKELSGVHTGQVTSVSVSPDGSSLLTNSRDNTLKLVDLRMYHVIATFQAPTYRNGANWSRSCFSPDGYYIAAGSADGALHIWNTNTRSLEKVLQEHSGAVCGTSWSPTGDYLFSAESNKTVCMWHTALTIP
ncbi:WD40-repeat-containing domain protein [Dichotomocladium elegans]|nr:WD40-repeat-containing domain protein [Dichotomocladium elegans]